MKGNIRHARTHARAHTHTTTTTTTTMVMPNANFLTVTKQNILKMEIILLGPMASFLLNVPLSLSYNYILTLLYLVAIYQATVLHTVGLC